MGKKKNQGAIRLEFKQPKVVKQHNRHGLAASGPVGPSRQSSSTCLLAKASLSGSLTSLTESFGGELEYETPLEKMIVKVKDKDTLMICIDAWETYFKEKSCICTANMNTTYEEFESLIINKQLDSNLTKCTKFVKKLRQYTESQRTSVENDIKGLNLSKYLSEVASAIVESKLKLGDLREIIGICSMLHQRYPEFSSALLENFKRILPGKIVDTASLSLVKVTVDFRLLTELILHGMIPVNDGFPLLLSSLRNLIMSLRDGMQCVLPIVSLCRAVGYELTGVVPKNIRKLCDKNGVQLPKCNVISEDKRQQMVTLLKEFYSAQTKLLLIVHEECLRSEMRNRKLMKTKGELLPERIEAHAEITLRFEKFYLNIKKMAYIFDMDIPELRALPAADPDEEVRKRILNEDGQDATFSSIVFFDDEETRSFYQDFPDLKLYLPPVAYRETVLQAAKESEAIAERELESSIIDEETEKAELTAIVSTEDVGDPEENDVPPSMRPGEEKDIDADKDIKPCFKAYLDGLKNCVNRNMVDKAAFEFIDKFNNKQNRRKLVRTIFHIPRQRADLLPLWARLVAILNPVMPDLGIELCTMLKKDFQYLVRKKHQTFIETKLKITRLIAELVNFRIFPKSDALHCLKLLLLDFVHHQIEMCCAFVETCGQFLHRHPESHRRMQIYLDEIIRKKKVKALEPRYLNLVDHAYNYVVNTKETATPKAKLLPCLEAYLQKVVWCDLTKANIEETIDILRRLDWDTDPETIPTAIKVLSNPCEMSYMKLPALASVISGLSDYRSDLGIKVLDAVLEEIKVGMDQNLVQCNQRRITHCVFLGQLYLYRVCSGMQIFTTLYDFITYGVKSTRMRRGNGRIIDRPEDLFRIRLACQLLKVCGEYFNHGSTKKALDTYIKYLQRYFWMKRVHPHWKKRYQRFPYGILEDLEETIKRVRPTAKIYKTWDEVYEDVKEMENEMLETVKKQLHQTGYDAIVSMKNLPCEKTEVLEQQPVAERQRNMAYPGNRGIMPQGTKTSKILGTSIGDPYLKYENPQEIEQTMADEEDLAFTKELERLCSQVNYSAARDGGKHMTSTIPIPLHISNYCCSKTTNVETGPSRNTGEEETVNFTLITRKGSKQQFKSLPVPVSAEFVINLKSREEAERIEKERVKKITLGMNDLQLAEEEKMLNAHLSSVRNSNAYLQFMRLD